MCLLNDAHLSAFLCTKHKQKWTYENFLHEVGRSWISEVQYPIESSSDELKWPEKQHQGGPNRNTPSRLYSEGHLESKEHFAIKKYLLIIGKKKNMQVLSHTFTYFST